MARWPAAGAVVAAAALSGCAVGTMYCTGEEQCTLRFARLFTDVEWSIERHEDGSKVVKYTSSPGTLDLGNLAKALTQGAKPKDAK